MTCQLKKKKKGKYSYEINIHVNNSVFIRHPRGRLTENTKEETVCTTIQLQ